MASFDNSPSWKSVVLFTGLILAALALAESVLGRVWWCECGHYNLTSWDIWSRHNSQHLIDPYSFTHVSHGLIFYAGLFALARTLTFNSRLLLAFTAEVLWELMENTSWIIERYRTATISLDYYGDSIVNSLGDVGFCMAGFYLASRIPTRTSVLFFLLTEATLLLFIGDCLALNIIMLIWPIDGIKNWQAAL